MALLLFTVVPFAAQGQKRLTKTLLNPDISSIHIDADLCYRIVLETADSNEVSVEAQMDGEYHKDLVVSFREDGQTLFIEPEFSPQFILPNDKLGAHKVVSVSLKIRLPAYQNVHLTALTCEVTARGTYQNLDIVQNDGSCHLAHLAESTTVQTGSAPIEVELETGVVEATSRYGQIFLEPIPKGDHYLRLVSTRGDITVRQSL